MVVVPAAIPPTTPEELTVPTEGVELLHVPDDAEPLRVTVFPTAMRLVEPYMTGVGVVPLTVIFLMATDGQAAVIA
jgi:hypothetical protein